MDVQPTNLQQLHDAIMSIAVLILAGIFDLVLVFYLETKMLNSLSHILVI